MGLLMNTTSFGALFVVHPAFLCTIESPKITISHLFYKPREDLITRMRDHEKLRPYNKIADIIINFGAYEISDGALGHVIGTFCKDQIV